MISVAPTLTEQGWNLMFRGIAGETITFVRMEIGNGELSEGTDIASLTELINPLVSFDISSIDTSNSGYVKITGSFDSAAITQDFRWTECGVYACGETYRVFSGTGSAKTFTLTDKPPVVNSVKVGGAAVTVSSYNPSTGVVTLATAPAAGTDNVFIRYPDTANTTLYAVVNDGDDAGKLKANATAVVTEQTIGFIVAIGQATSVTAILSDSVIYATKAELDAHVNAENPHGIDKYTVDLGNVPNVSTNDQTPTYTTPSTLAELVSGEKLSVAFGKLSRLIKNFITHINTLNAHGVTAAGIGAAASSHNHSASDITSGTLSASRGGTGYSSLTALKSAIFNSPLFTGVPRAPTADTGTSTEQIATCEFVQQEMTEAGAHTHSNKDVLDSVTQDMVTNAHSHNNLGVLNSITSAKVSQWNGMSANINNAVALCKTMVEAVDLTLDQIYQSSVPWVYIQGGTENRAINGWIKIRALRNSNSNFCIAGDIYNFVDYITGNSGSFSQDETVWLYCKHENNQFAAYVMHESITPAQYAAAYAQRGF